MALKIEGWGCVIVGGGKLALAKARGLYRAGGRLTVIAPTIDKGFNDFEGVEQKTRPFKDEDLEGAFIAVAATNDPVVNRAVAAGCEKRGVLCNMADDPEESQFVVPALVSRGPLQIAVSTSGASPAFAARIREQLDEWLPEDVEEYVRFLDTARHHAKKRISDPKQRRKIAQYMASMKGYARFKQLDTEGRYRWVESIVKDPQQIEDNS